MSVPSFSEQRRSWANPPVDDVGYLPSEELLEKTDEELVELIQTMWRARYYGWRNYENLWRDVMGLDDTHDSVVLDYGCGVGLESLEYARMGNEIYVADIAPDNVKLAQRVLKAFGHEAADAYEIQGRSPFIHEIDGEQLDVIHCSGVLHHIPKPVPVVAKMASWLVPDGELRLMLYSEIAWELATARVPPEVVTDDPGFKTFVQAMDGVGGYADWYNRERLQSRFGEWFRLERFEYLTQSRNYIGAVLTKL